MVHPALHALDLIEQAEETRGAIAPFDRKLRFWTQVFVNVTTRENLIAVSDNSHRLLAVDRQRQKSFLRLPRGRLAFEIEVKLVRHHRGHGERWLDASKGNQVVEVR